MPFDNTETLTEFDQDILIFKRAKVILIEQGWCRYVLRDGRGRHCVNGAIVEAMQGFVEESRGCIKPDVWSQYHRLMNKIGLMNGGYPTMYFNDDQTSVEPVLDLLDKAIAQPRPLS